MKVYDKQYINGMWREGRGAHVLENRDPFTGELLYTYKSASEQDLDEAYRAAEAAQPGWEALAPADKQAYLEKLIPAIESMREEIYDVLARESGSVRAKADFEYATSLAFVRQCLAYPQRLEGKILPSDTPGKENYVFKRPKGVIGVIAPWNVPLVLAMRSVIPAVATGNTVVLKPASDTPASAMLIASFFDRAGFPKGVVNVIAGRGADIGDAIVTHPVPALISFTGSTAVGRRIGEQAGRALKDVSLELGGNNAMLVLRDADIGRAAAAARFGAYFHQGQVCMSLNRIIVEESVYDAFVEALVAEVRALPVGDPKDEATFIGPIINKAQADGIESLVRATLAAGATAALEGKREGNLIWPWVLTNVTNDMPAACNEVFGPVCSVIRAKDEDDAVRIANDTEYGLSGSVFTRDRYHGMQVAARIHTGMVHVNDQSINDEPNVMFGGEKASGIGRFNGQWVVDKFTSDRWISVQSAYRF